MQFADNTGPDQHVHLCRLIQAFSVCWHILQYPLILWGQWRPRSACTYLYRLIRASFVCKLHMSPFRVAWGPFFCTALYVAHAGFLEIYCIGPNYCTYSYKRIVKQFPTLQITASVLFVYFFIKAYIAGMHLNCIDLSMQFKWVPKHMLL